MVDPIPFPGFERFLFDAPLYARYLRPNDSSESGRQVDGYCPTCKRHGTFNVVRKSGPRPWQELRGSEEIILRCARDDKHHIVFHIMFEKRAIQKYGQFPSFADIAQSESKTVRSLLSDEESKELNRAIRAAANGVGIGSYVYMRRILERIIRTRFDEYKAQEGWTDKQFIELRMAERIALMKDHLPEFMVTNKQLYSILSAGVHELEEEACLNFFPIARASIEYILEDDVRKKEELARRAEIKRAIADYETPRK